MMEPIQSHATAADKPACKAGVQEVCRKVFNMTSICVGAA